MSGHILTPFCALARSLARVPRQQVPPVPSFEGVEIPEHLRGRPFVIRDSDGRVVATCNMPKFDPHVSALVG